MKRNNILYRIAALLLFVTLTAACTNEDDYAAPGTDGTTPAAPLTITVTDGAYAPAPEPDGGNTPDTRAVERGYATEFTKGDKIGLYVVEKENASNPAAGKSTFLHQNLCLTHDGKGWTLPDGTELTHCPPEGGEILYFAYYPYQSDMEGKVDIYAENAEGAVTTEAWWFFRELIEKWVPQKLQDTYEAYTASDLMVARGTVAKRTDGTDGSVLSFTMEHQMALVVMRLPTTKYTYTETIGGVKTEKSYRLYTGLTSNGWKENSYTARYLENPSRGSYYTLKEFYYNSSLKLCGYDFLTKNLTDRGTYHLVTIEGGKETQGDRPLREGDFYMKDGTIIPQENVKVNMPANVQKDCLGVVFWVGENEGRHWTQPSHKSGDHLLMRDHPGCEHGMVVALRDASAGDVWATGSGASEELYVWAENFNGFNAGEQADWSAISASDVNSFGYCSSHRVKLYSAHHPDATFPAYNTISSYATRYPAPGSSSGWFFPSRSELAMMCYGKAYNYQDKNPERRDFLNEQFPKAGGTAFKGRYWSTMDDMENAWSIDFDGATNYITYPKSNTHKVRAVLAF